MNMQEIKDIVYANEAIIINDEGEKVDSKLSKVAKKAAEKRLRKEISGAYEKFASRFPVKEENEANEDVSCSTVMGGAQTAAPLGVVTIKEVKDVVYGEDS